MNIKISIAIFILLSFFNIGAISDNFCGSKNTLSILENNMRSRSEFEENGVKLQYKTKEDLQKELYRIKKNLTSSIEGKCEEVGANEFDIVSNTCNTNVKMWYESGCNYVEITLINSNCKYSIAYLENILRKLEDYKAEKIQYYSYYEGKELEENYSIDEFIKENKIQEPKLLKISNGYTGIGFLNNRDKINFAQVRYDTGSHIIIGTPIIFTTY